MLTATTVPQTGTVVCDDRMFEFCETVSVTAGLSVGRMSTTQNELSRQYRF